MLEVRNLVKIYKPKKGVPVRALDGVSLRFPETGMVFLLGKSGSGKSTLLNLLGGLDRYNSGEILIKGCSSKTFRQRHFDSYRNTYLGFIFQEYNILDEFSVGANIALALQLQGKKPDSQVINDILAQVDMAGYGNRKPNELSGGQKQRVAIARALVKNPEIIMADEPTGALDSTTGQQVLTTLKKLSTQKLVIVVSHDREFAEKYGDRIIELADGKVIRDVERQNGMAAEDLTHPVFEADTIHVPLDYVFTPEDSVAITQYIQHQLSQGRELTVKPSIASDLEFVPTDEGRIPVLSQGYHLIRSRLPLRYAFKLGSSGLKHKKFRLFMTIFLCVIAFTLFGLSDTVAGFSYAKTAVSSLMHPDSQVSYASFEMQQEITEGKYSYYQNISISHDALEQLAQKTGLSVYPVYAFGDGHDYSVQNNLDMESYSGPANKVELALSSVTGWVASDPKLLEDMGAELVAGRLPAPGSREVAISTYLYKAFQSYGYQAYSDQTEEGVLSISPNSAANCAIRSYDDLIGKEITFDRNVTMTVCGIVDSGIDYERYKPLEYPPDGSSFADELIYTVLMKEWNYATTYSLTGLAIVDESILPELANRYCNFYVMGGLEMWDNNKCLSLAEVDPEKITWENGKARTELADGECIVSRSVLESNESVYIDENGNLISENPGEDGDSGYFGMTGDVWLSGSYGPGSTVTTVKVVGILEDGEGLERYAVFSNAVLAKLGYVVPGSDQKPPVTQTLSPMPKERSKVEVLAELSDQSFAAEDGNRYLYNLQNPVCFELRNLKEVFAVLKDVFFWVGLVMLVFASLLFSNFIGTSVAYKKRQIGILRAIGSRSNDVFRIFFAESFIIAMINYAISMAVTLGISVWVNSVIRNEAGLLLTVLNVGIRQFVVLLVICVLSAFVASFLPVWRIASKRPVDAIQDR